PGIGKFVSEDPLRFAASVNFYSYVLNDPINFIDPNGKEIAIALSAVAITAGEIGSMFTAAFLSGYAVGTAINQAGLDDLIQTYAVDGWLDLRPDASPISHVDIHNAKRSPKWEPPTNPAQEPPAEIPEGWNVRVMPPDAEAGYPDGYWVLEKPMANGSWQPIDPSTMRPGKRCETHVPRPPAKK
ncbi:MAG: hypothetical protein L0287_19135, partial [Anaerolineae bacterium]|nr:hypothetical protein [Anaerolineae bacterium]